MSIAGIVRGIETDAVVIDIERAFSSQTSSTSNAACLGVLAHMESDSCTICMA